MVNETNKNESMLALCKKFPKPGLWKIDAPIPQIGPNDVLIKIKKTAICGTDLHIYNWDHWSQKNVPTPLITGHEFMGTVARLGSQVVGLKIGDRVSGEGHLTCSYCRNCRAGKKHLCRNTKGIGVNHQGAFAEYLAMPQENVFKIPDAINDDVAAIFDPFGNATHTALSFDLVGEDVLITGAGPIGIMSAAICRHVGAKNVIITDVSDYRLQLANKFPNIVTVNTIKQDIKQVLKDLNIVEGIDVGLEMSGNAAALKQQLDLLIHGGKLAMLGIFPDEVAVDWDKVIFKGLTLKGIYGREMFETWYKMTSMLQSGLDISPIITQVIDVENFEDGFKLMSEGKSGKIVLSWS